jgi:hypothetical protein
MKAAGDRGASADGPHHDRLVKKSFGAKQQRVPAPIGRESAVRGAFGLDHYCAGPRKEIFRAECDTARRELRRRPLSADRQSVIGLRGANDTIPSFIPKRFLPTLTSLSALQSGMND